MKSDKCLLVLTPPGKVFFYEEDAAEYAGCSRSSLWRLANKDQTIGKNHKVKITTIKYGEAMMFGTDIYYSERFCNHKWLYEPENEKWFFDLDEAAKEYRPNEYAKDPENAKRLITYCIKNHKPVQGERQFLSYKTRYDYAEIMGKNAPILHKFVKFSKDYS